MNGEYSIYPEGKYMPLRHRLNKWAKYSHKPMTRKDMIYFYDKVRIRRVMAPEWLTQLLHNLTVRNVLQKSREERCNSIYRSIYAITSGEKGIRGMPPYNARIRKKTQGKLNCLLNQ